MMRNRKIALETYPDFFTEEDGFSFVYEEEWENLSEALADEVRRLIDVGNWEDAGKIIELISQKPDEKFCVRTVWCNV